MDSNHLNRESDKEREVEFRVLNHSRSFGSNGSELYATLNMTLFCGNRNTLAK